MQTCGPTHGQTCAPTSAILTLLVVANIIFQENFISAGDIIFSALFALDVTIRLLVLGGKFFKVCMNYVPQLQACEAVPLGGSGRPM